MKVLVITDDTWHPAEVIEMGLAPLNGNFDMTYIRTAKDILTPGYLRDFDMMMVCKGDCLNSGNHAPWFEEGVTEVMPRDFRRFVEEGGGFVALHAGNCFRRGSAMTELTGSCFLGHPPRCEVSLNFERSPLTEGAVDFTERDEHYQMEIDAKDIVPFAYSTSSSGERQVAGYTRLLGQGRGRRVYAGAYLDHAFPPFHTKSSGKSPALGRGRASAIKQIVQNANPKEKGPVIFTDNRAL